MGNSLPYGLTCEKVIGILNRFADTRDGDVAKFQHPFADVYAKKLYTGPTAVLSIEAQLRKLETLDDIREHLDSNEELQRLIGLDSIHYSSLHRKFESLPTEWLQHLALKILGAVDRYYRTHTPSTKVGPLHVVDSTQISLPKRTEDWAYCSKDLNGIKVHMRYVVLGPDVSYPDRFVMSTAAVSDQEGAVELVRDKDATYVLDRGYINYAMYHDWDTNGQKFVCRIKANSKTTILEEFAMPEGTNVTRDARVQLQYGKTNTFELRLVEYKDDQGRVYRVVTNRWDLEATEIADIYKQRWAIELFFKWMKQHLKVVRLYNYNPTAVWNQILLAMIAYGLLELVRIELGTKVRLSRILRLLKSHWFNGWDKFLAALYRKPTRTSRGRVRKRKRGRPRKHPKKLKAVKTIIR